MKVINQSHEILTSIADIKKIPAMIEKAGRTCYKSENKITEDSADRFCKMLIKRDHGAMIEHGSISVRFITDRGVTHELVRHRVASFAQESTRYVNYKEGIYYIRPVQGSLPGKSNPSVGKLCEGSLIWYRSMEYLEKAYINMIALGCKPQEARAVLPNSLKTEIVVTANIREWRHIFSLRTAKDAHPQIRGLMIPLLKELKEITPCLFSDITIEGEDHEI